MTEREPETSFLKDFTFSNIIKAELGTRTLAPSEKTWIGIVCALHEELFTDLIKSTDFDNARDELVRSSPSTIVIGDKDGYKYVSRIKCSISRADAAASWAHCQNIFYKIRKFRPNFELTITVKWQNVPRAMYPGQIKFLRPENVSDLDVD